MVIELSNLTFTDQDDIVPASGVEQIVNTGIANALTGDDRITGTAMRGSATIGAHNIIYGIYNSETLNTNDGNDIIMGVCSNVEGNFYDSADYFGISNDQGIIDTGDGNDTIIGTSNISPSITNEGTNLNGAGFSSYFATVNTGNGDDIIMGTAPGIGFMSWMGILDTGNGNDMITGIGNLALANEGGSFNTGGGNDTIIGNGIDLGVENGGVMDTGDGNDIIIGTNITADPYQRYLAGINNGDKIITGNGNDLIIGTGSTGIYNLGIINTGNGDDSLIANGGFESDSNMSGSVLLGNGTDYLKGFGNGKFNGGNGRDTLELTPGSYTIGIVGTAVNFTKGNQLMITSEFEKLKAGSTIYDFTSLTAGQIITVA
jgi:hypothetical protein